MSADISFCLGSAAEWAEEAETRILHVAGLLLRHEQHEEDKQWDDRNDVAEELRHELARVIGLVKLIKENVPEHDEAMWAMKVLRAAPPREEEETDDAAEE